MSSIPLHPKPAPATPTPSPASPNPLPALLQTPSGLALLELQGTINLPPALLPDLLADPSSAAATRVPVGRLHFPDYHPALPPGDDGWMRRVWLFVGEHQRLQGEVRRLPRAVAVLRRRRRRPAVPRVEEEEEGDAEGEGELEVVEVVKFKVVFSQRPEPVGGLEGAAAGV
ncbi:hypothetical protein BT67DRAFT_450635 [Trichocladium antarcticum]|uniref:Sister chromatid cohesion protein Ctf8 n=1 Tax=Trichocladium antarcticum TaxID=1450529 RepID=A0AAN6ZCN5_9PEZI|nr:hypothetical protein BT67DRAFT_450635 [Trichocladium antarcticum]